MVSSPAPRTSADPEPAQGGQVQTLRRPWSIWALIGWSVVLWSSRLRNVLSNDDLDSTGRLIRVAIVVIFVGLAGWAFLGSRRRQWAPVWVLVVWTLVYWPVRGGGILIDDYSAGFKVVHTVLAIVSIGLAALCARRLMSDRSFGDNR